MKSRYQDKVVWITGGGSGIGRALALEFARQGADVAVSGRRVDKLKEVVAQVEALGQRGLVVPCDVVDEEQVQAAVASVVSEWGQLDVAIANAGFGVGGKLEDLSAQDWRRQFDVNVVGAAITARHALPELRKTKGRVALVGSVAGVVAFPKVSAYHASKYAVRAIGQCLSMELVGSGVSCTVLQPGFVESEINQVDNQGRFRPDWTDDKGHQPPQAVMWSSERAAKVCAAAVWRRKREFTFTGHGRVAVFLGRHTPGLVHHMVTASTHAQHVFRKQK